ncbi:unnamed protein product, partial [Brassica rapa subsp. trilocularis]
MRCFEANKMTRRDEKFKLWTKSGSTGLSLSSLACFENGGFPVGLEASWLWGGTSVYPHTGPELAKLLRFVELFFVITPFFFFSIGVASSLFLWVVLHGSLPLAFSTSSVEDISSFEFLSLEFWWARTLACEVSAVAGHSPRRFWIWRIFFMSDFFIFCIYNSRFCLYHPGLAFILFYFTSRLVFF